MDSTPPRFASASPDHTDAHISSLEQDFCSNFSCCGLALADLHELVDHFEEYHVVVLARDGRPIYPAPVADPESNATLHDACASIVLSYPQTDPPVPPPLFQSLLDPSFQLTHAARTYRHITDSDVDLDSASYSSGSTHPSPCPSEPMCLPPSLLSSSHAPTFAPETPNGQHKHASKSPVRTRPWSAITGARTERRADVRYAPAKRREREKAYKCPHPGCLKSYLNPNGLKYHLEKGTCTTADA